MGFQQIAVVVLYISSIVVSVVHDGQMRPVSARNTTLAAVVIMALLWTGGFFGLR